MRKILVMAFIVISIVAKGQNVQWGSVVLDFSSELTAIKYSANQILGKPNSSPSGEQASFAWIPKKTNSKEFIKIGYDNPMSISQIAIAESYNPGGLSKVYVYDENDKEYLINTYSPRIIPVKSRMLNIFFEKTPYKVKAVKLEYEGAEVYSIDAVAISDSHEPVVAQVNIPDFINIDITKERLSSNINSKYKDCKPVFSPDGKTLYFSRKNHPDNVGGVNDDEDIWYSELDSTGHWQLAKNLVELNNAGPNFVSSATSDDKSVLLVLGNQYLKKSKMAAGVSVSSNASGHWSRPQSLNVAYNYNYSDNASFFLAHNHKVLLLSVMRDNTMGGRDLYVSFLESDNVWSEPINIGSTVNTVGEESGPFLVSDDKTMYFSSDGYSGFGGSDIYITKRLDDTWTNWSEPQNLGPAINSQYEDLFFSIPNNSNYAYYSQGVDENDLDIFRIDLAVLEKQRPVVAVSREPLNAKTSKTFITISGKVLNIKTNNPVGAKIIYERLSDGKEIGITASNVGTGGYKLLLPTGEMYGIRAEADGFLAESTNIDLRNINQIDDHVEGKDLYLVPIEKEATIVLNNVFFEFDKTVLKKESYPELNRVVTFLNDHVKTQIAIIGHTDSVGSGMYNMVLSKRRAESVKRYLTSKGIDDKRLEIRYYGEIRPVTENKTDEGRRKNRRVEFKILNE